MSRNSSARVLPHLVSVVALGGLVLATFHNSLDAGFTVDNREMLGQVRIHEASYENVQQILSQDYWWPSWVSGAYRPLSEGPGTVVGRYKLLQQIGAGGFGVVFMAEQEQPVRRLVLAKAGLWVLTSRELVRFQNNSWEKISSEPVADVCEHLGEVVVARDHGLWRLHDSKLEPLTSTQSPFPITRVVSYSETLYLHGPGRLTIFDGARIGARNVWNWSAEQIWDWGELPSLNGVALKSFY